MEYISGEIFEKYSKPKSLKFESFLSALKNILFGIKIQWQHMRGKNKFDTTFNMGCWGGGRTAPAHGESVGKIANEGDG